ncbi:MAG TPA: ABC transporter permease [Streptosporangiaceae bacterium]|nr:ABC transporter permease [Streptosporangiaceae bacterium]
MTRLVAALRGLAHRRGSTLLILAVALVAAAAAATGPAYYAAAKTSVLRDALHSGGALSRGVEATTTGALPGLVATLQGEVDDQLSAGLGPGPARRLFAPPIADLEGTGVWSTSQTTIPVDWRTGICAHLRISGSCPTEAGQVIASQTVARRYSLHVGERLSVSGWAQLTVTGIYRIPDVAQDYWFGRGSAFFPMEGPTPATRGPSDALDALFTSHATMAAAPATAQGTGVLDYPLVTDHVTAADVPRLQSGIEALVNSTQLQLDQVPVASGIPGTFATIEASWRTVLVPIWLITAQLLTVSWLLLFLAVTDAVEARGPEIALARLRGRGRWRTLVFGLSEPAMLLIMALPLGVLVSLAATTALGSLLLLPGTAVSMPLTGWLAAAAATAGGLVAVIIAARRTLRRPVIEQWRRAGRRATDRSWVVDAILLTGAAGGLLELAINGEIGSTGHSVLSLLVPGLLGLAVAVVASRLLPLACRAAFRRTGRRGGVSTYLAVRHIARRPGGIRTTIVLATAFALAAFAVTAWSVNRDNNHLLAYTDAGAPTVLTVTTPAGKDLGAIVARADPGGRKAAVVDKFVSLTSGSAGTAMLAVDPQRFAHVAFWGSGFSAEPLRTLAAKLDPQAPAPVTVTGSTLRVTVDVSKLSQPGEQLYANVTVGASPVSLGTLPTHGTVTLAGALLGCPCVVQGFYLQPSARNIRLATPISGSLTFAGLAYQGGTGWQSARPGLFSSTAAWKSGDSFSPPDVLRAGAAGLGWTFASTSVAAPTLISVNRPYPMPALAPEAMIGGRGSLFQGVGLDGSPLPVRIVAAVAAVPGAPTNGFITDRQYAELAAGQNIPQAQQQVWLAEGAQSLIEPRLIAAGVRVTSVTSAAAAAAALGRQGPALASVLFLADAAAAALLAAGAAILGLYLSARRRRYEYAALAASGVSRRTLRGAVLIELAVVLGFGTIVGIATGLAAAAMALRAVPEFVTNPAAPPLSYVPAIGPLTTLLGTAVALLIAVAVTLSITIVRGVELEQLREAPA